MHSKWMGNPCRRPDALGLCVSHTHASIRTVLRPSHGGFHAHPVGSAQTQRHPPFWSPEIVIIITAIIIMDDDDH